MTGNNPVWGTARNPHDTGRYAGGSSSGSGAAVACGVAAFSIGGLREGHAGAGGRRRPERVATAVPTPKTPTHAAHSPTGQSFLHR